MLHGRLRALIGGFGVRISFVGACLVGFVLDYCGFVLDVL